MDQIKTNRWIARIVIIGWLFGWYVKGCFYYPYLTHTVYQYPVTHPLFPNLFLDPNLSTVSYFLPLVAGVTLFSRRRLNFCLISGILLICSMMLTLHIDTYNDATFVTSFWVALWLLWFSLSLDRTDEALRRHGRKLAQCIVGLIFLGGFAGKLTAGYWSGEVIYNIFLSTKDTPVGTILNVFPAELRPVITMYISRTIIAGELILALSPFLSYRLVAVLAAAVFSIMTLFSTWRIMSVNSSLMGMLLGCWLWEKFERQKMSGNPQ